MVAILLVIAVVLAVASIMLRNSTEKSEKRFENRPYVVTDPAKDLQTNQKYAIVRLLTIVQGVSPISAYDREATQISQNTIISLGISMSEVERVLRAYSAHGPEREMQMIFDSLSEIRDKSYLSQLYRKCRKIAEISTDRDMIDGVDNIFHQLKINYAF